MRRLFAGALISLITSLTPLAVHADWRDEVPVLRVGYLSTGSAAAEAARLEPFRAYLEVAIGQPVELMPAATYGGLIEAVADSRTQYVMLSATAYAAAAAACDCVEPLAVASAFDRSTAFRAILLARAGSRFTGLADLAGARVALSAEDSVAGRLLPMRAFAESGIDPRVEAVAGPEAAVRALVAGEVDAAAAWSSMTGDASAGYSFGALTRLVIDGRLSMDDVRVIWQSPPVPFGPHAVRIDLPSDLKLLLADALFDMAARSPEALEAVDRSGYGGGGFVAVDPALYEVLAPFAGGG